MKYFLYKYPSFNQLREFIEAHPRTSVCEIRNHFNQRGNDIISLTITKHKNGEFFTYLFTFLKQDYVIWDNYDSSIYPSDGKFGPLVFSIES